MKRLAAGFSTLLILALFTVMPVLAQHGRPGMMAQSDSMRGVRMGMMQGGMMENMQGMHRMMQNPMHRSSMMAFMLPTLADTLGLSESQTGQLNELKEELMTQRQEQRKHLMTRQKELMGLFEGGQTPASEAVRQHLMAMAEMRARQRAAMYETAQEMRQVLTDEQRETLNDLTPQQKMHQMMSRMPMMDMMQMMRAMHGGTMGPGMMQGGMMQNMPMKKGEMMRQSGVHKMPRHQNRQNR